MSKRLALVIITAVVMSGCSTYAANRYSISVDNVTALRNLDGTEIAVGTFTASEPGKTEIMCRAVGPIKTPDGQTFENFIKNALEDELKIAEVYSASAPVTLTGNLDSIDFSSASGVWNIALTVSSTNGNSLSVSESYSYDTSFYGETACNQTAQALMPAVQNIIGKIVNDSKFERLIR